MKSNYQSSKLHPADLYDQLKKGGNHIICLGQDGTKAFILLAALRNRAHELHSKYGSYKTVIIEPDKEHANERHRLISDHTELSIANYFETNKDVDNLDVKADNLKNGQVIILPIELVAEVLLPETRINFMILDHADLLLCKGIGPIEDLVSRYNDKQILAFMCSLIHNNNELTPLDTLKLIKRLESVFNAKCETSSDLRSLSRQSPIIDVETIKCKTSQLMICEEVLLADSLLREFCTLISDEKLEDTRTLIEPDAAVDVDQAHPHLKASALSPAKQLVLVRSCLSDVIYAIHCLGFWCVRRTVKLYLTEFSRLLSHESASGNLLFAASTILNCFYGRLDELILRSETHTKSSRQIPLHSATDQLKSLLECIRKLRSTVNTTAPICIVHVRKRIIAKVIALWLSEVASSNEEYSFIKPNYVVGSSRKHRNRMSVDNFDLHHETTIRDFRFGNCNVLVTSAISERCTDIPRCNLVVSFDIPARFSEFIQAKVNCRYDSSRYVIMLNAMTDADSDKRIVSYITMERLLNNKGKRSSEVDETDLTKAQEPNFPLYPSKSSKNPATIWRSISIINKYCTKLPSDSFTRLSPEWQIHDIERDSTTQYFCMIRLPINSPISARSSIYGPVMPTRNLAMRAAAYTACKVLHRSGELDDNMCPITKESMKSIATFSSHKESRHHPKSRVTHRGQSIGSTKHRQYYRKRIAKVFSGPQLSSETKCFLYKIAMALTCPIPDEQNRRGRRVVDPSETNCNYAIVCSSRLPKICCFPVFTRSGEVLISLELIAENFTLAKERINDLRLFHEYTFSKVLRLEKYPTVFDPDNSLFTVLLAPVIDDNIKGTEIDWAFVTKIVHSDQDSQVPSIEERKRFKFRLEDYVDAVVIPWYRLTDRQQFAYYVAEICVNLNPTSPFPDESSGFETFVDYYKSKYNIDIYNTEQPVLDVDHTSARLNLLTPRYVNRKGRTLPSSTAKTRRESRESLVQKQLLIPELCSIHPFPASFWRKAVCLPCIFYRLNSLFLAEELRREVAKDTQVGFVEPPADYQWPQLDFGWSLKDVMNNQNHEDDEEEVEAEVKPVIKGKKYQKKVSKPKLVYQEKEECSTSQTQLETDGQDFVIDHFDPTKVFIPDIPLDAPDSEWMNIKLISSSNQGDSDQRGWDQPLEQQDIFLEHTNEINWSDCEMEFDGEVSEKPGRVRCGSPSSFEPKFFTTPNRLELQNQRQQQQQQQQPKHNLKQQSKSIAFENGTSDMSSEDSDASSEGSIAKVILDSSDEWSLDENDDDEAAESSYEEMKSGFQPDWMDSKSKKQPLLRELFVPVHRASENPNSDSTDKFYSLMKEYLQRDDPNSETTLTEQLEKLEVSGINVEESSTQLLIQLLNEVFEKKTTFSSEAVASTVKKWFKMMNMLDSRVANTLKKEPDLFKDNGIELVAVDDSLGDYDLQVQPTFGELLPNRDVNCNWSNEEWKKIKFDPTIGEIKSNGPGPSVIIQALTMSNASDGINLERLETVGDSFLKYSITAYLYCMFPSMHEGKLSYLRSTEISNANLYQLGRSKCLGELMSATKFEPNDNWLAPGYTVTDTLSEQRDNNGNKKREIDKALAEVPYDLLRQHSIPDKSIADCVEALIGAYLTASGSRAALLFMRWLGLKVIPPTFDLDEDVKQYNEEAKDVIWRWLETPPSPLICMEPYFADQSISSHYTIVRNDPRKELDCLYYANNLDKFEADIGYSFRDKAYLVQAFTHNSFYENHVTDCHQRLEFLGDALLDYLITRYLFEDPRCHSPGTLTDLRSALVNNTFFASLAVKYKFHKYLKFISDELLHVIDGFVKKFRFDNTNVITKGYTLLINEGESEYAEDIEVPKALGDVFESVAGSIYLDSGMSLDQVWQVYFKMMKPEIEYFSSHVPKSPIRELLESKPQNVRFSPSELAPDRKHRVVAEVFGLGRFTGVGRNKHSAKSTAAKRALRMLTIRGNKEDEKEQEQEQDEAGLGSEGAVGTEADEGENENGNEVEETD